MKRQQEEFKPNVDRLVRSAIKDERYCSFILDHLERPNGEGVDRLDRLWLRASQSDMTVAEFIRYQKGE